MKGESIRKGMALKPKDMLHHKVKFIKQDVNLAIANVTKY